MENQAPDIVMFVGTKFYPTADSFIKEAFNLGCAKRVSMLPGEIMPGKSRCFLAHDEGKKGQGRIFGFFVISGVDIILDDEEKIKKYQQDYERHGCPPAPDTLPQDAISGLALHGARVPSEVRLASEVASRD